MLAWTGFVLLTLIGLALTVIGVLDLLKKAGVTIDDKTAIGLMAAGVGIVAIVWIPAIQRHGNAITISFLGVELTFKGAETPAANTSSPTEETGVPPTPMKATPAKPSKGSSEPALNETTPTPTSPVDARPVELSESEPAPVQPIPESVRPPSIDRTQPEPESVTPPSTFSDCMKYLKSNDEAQQRAALDTIAAAVASGTFTRGQARTLARSRKRKEFALSKDLAREFPQVWAHLATVV